MATLEKIRSKSGLLVGVIGVALLAFIIGDFLNSGRSFMNGNATTIAEVNGNKIEITKFQQSFEQARQQAQAEASQQGRTLPSSADAYINQQVYNSLVMEILLNEQLEELGLDVTSDELLALVQGNNVPVEIMQGYGQYFMDPATGAFNSAAFLQYLQQLMGTDVSTLEAQQAQQVAAEQAQWLSLEKLMKDNLARVKYTDLLLNALAPNKLEVALMTEGDKKQRDFAYAMQAYTTVADSTVQVSDQEIEARYEASKELFKQQGEMRTVKYLAVDVNPSAADYQTAQTKIASLKNQFATTSDVALLLTNESVVPYGDYFLAENLLSPELEAFVATATLGEVSEPVQDGDSFHMYRLMDKTVAPDSLNLNVMMVPSTLTDSVMNLLQGGADFAETAISLSNYSQVNATGGALGWITDSYKLSYGADLVDASFAAKADDYFTVSPNPQTTLIAQVTERTAPVAKVKLAELVVAVKISAETKEGLYNNLSQYIAENNNAAKLEEAAAEAGYRVQTLDVDKSTVALGSIANGREAVRYAFNNDVDEMSKIMEFDEKSKYGVVVVSAISDEEYLPVSDTNVKNYLRSQLLNEKKAEVIKKQLAAKSPATMEAYAAAMSATLDTARFVTYNTPTISGIGNEPILNGVVAASKENVVSAPLAGNQGVYVVSVIASQENGAPVTPDAAKSMTQSTLTNGLNQQLFQVLLNNAEISDNRVNFF